MQRQKQQKNSDLSFMSSKIGVSIHFFFPAPHTAMRQYCNELHTNMYYNAVNLNAEDVLAFQQKPIT